MSFIDGSLSTPINTALLLLTLYYAQTIIFPSTSRPRSAAEVPKSYEKGYSWMPANHPPTVLFQTYTPRTLEPFNGKDGGRILLAIDGIVFDVTTGRGFYGPEGMYGNFAGRDASRGMAKQSFDVEMLTPVDQPLDKLQDLDASEIENMRGWIDHFSNKYISCGKLVENDAA
ncbi:cytochrome b5-like heme/steroid binding domain-containing protein [Hysterangium stoloniferum]|nr:cytochrome b5-like heme/steroid binding domain-containing protein [Hysterangium stoloniferum]